jgi:hypothetical protein
MKHLALLALIWIGGPILAYVNLYAGAAFLAIFMLAMDWRRFWPSERVDSGRKRPGTPR